jgi:3-oxoacyl-[acyl-carrier-protein] synthase-3
MGVRRFAMKLGEIHINGVGTCVPDRIKTADAVERGLYDARAMENSGLVSISVAGDTPAPDLAISAAQIALKHDSSAASEVGLLMHSHIHPQGPDGWSAQHYINRHTVNRPIPSTVVNNGCLGVLSSIMLGGTWLRAGSSGESVLITSADNVGTPAVDRWNASYLYVLADSGGALLMSRRPGIATILAVASVSDPALEQLHRGGEPLFPPGITVGKTLDFNERLAYCREKWLSGEMVPIGDFGTVISSAYRKALDDAGLTADDVARVVHVGFAHQPLHDLFLDPLDVDDERAVWDFTRHVGHAGPVDPILGLDYLLNSAAVRRGDIVALTSGAPGMEASCAILRITGI